MQQFMKYILGILFGVLISCGGVTPEDMSLAPVVESGNSFPDGSLSEEAEAESEFVSEMDARFQNLVGFYSGTTFREGPKSLGDEDSVCNSEINLYIGDNRSYYGCLNMLTTFVATGEPEYPGTQSYCFSGQIKMYPESENIYKFLTYYHVGDYLRYEQQGYTSVQSEFISDDVLTKDYVTVEGDQLRPDFPVVQEAINTFWTNIVSDTGFRTCDWSQAYVLDRIEGSDLESMYEENLIDATYKIQNYNGYVVEEL